LLDFFEEADPVSESFFSSWAGVAGTLAFSFFVFVPNRLPKMLRLFFFDEELADSFVELASLAFESVGETRLTVGKYK